MSLGPTLPLELLPEILEHLPKVHYLAQIALVNHTFHQSTIPLLYKRTSIYSWHKDAKTRFIQLFRTLATCPHLARYVHRLEIRVFPKSRFTKEISDYVLQGLKNCLNLESCSWTRDGSLTSDILLTLLQQPSPSHDNTAITTSPTNSLRELEINGNHSDFYNPRLLLRFRRLTKISIIMPTTKVVKVLEEWVKVLDGTLKNLNVICKVSPRITDDNLICMAPFLKNLETLQLTGCPKVTHKGISAILNENETGITTLGLEGLSPRFDLLQLLPTSSSTNSPLRNLRSITLSIPPAHVIPSSLHHPASPLQAFEAPFTTNLLRYTTALLNVLTHTPLLERFQIYSPHMFIEPCSATADLFLGLVRLHGTRLRRISVHRMLIGMDVIREICNSCINMQEFFVVVEPGSLDELADYIHLAKSLRTTHINYPLEAHDEGGGVPILLLQHALQFVRRCANPTLTQFGCNARVWHVNRKFTTNESGEMECELYLVPYESPGIPEQFLVVRT